jgi:hypothetical protein
MISAGIFLATAVVWVRSYRNSETFYTIEPDGDVWAIDTFGGEISFWTGIAPPDAPPGSGHEHWDYPQTFTSIQQAVIDPTGDDLWLLGFGYTTSRHFPLTYKVVPQRGYITHTRGVVIPYWFIALIAGIAPVRWVIRRMRAARNTVAGACPHCGYDLRASHDRCPECGTPIESITRSPARPAS